MCREAEIDFDSYVINENGQIFSKYWGKELIGCPDKDGYVFVKLKLKTGRYSQFRLHRVIWVYFNGLIPDNMQIDHIIPLSNGGNNALSNLRLTTPKENSNNPLTLLNLSESLKGKKFPLERKLRARARFSCYTKKCYQFSLDGSFIGEYPSVSEAARQLNLSSGNIANCCRGLCKTYGGYRWQYVK